MRLRYDFMIAGPISKSAQEHQSDAPIWLGRALYFLLHPFSLQKGAGPVRELE